MVLYFLLSSGLDSLGLAILRTHSLNSTRRIKAVNEQQQLNTEESPPPVKVQPKIKVASLIQAAKPASSQQAEMTFDVDSFNF